MRVLVVDDEPQTREICSRALRAGRRLRLAGIPGPVTPSRLLRHGGGPRTK